MSSVATVLGWNCFMQIVVLWRWKHFWSFIHGSQRLDESGELCPGETAGHCPARGTPAMSACTFSVSVSRNQSIDYMWAIFVWTAYSFSGVSLRYDCAAPQAAASWVMKLWTGSCNFPTDKLQIAASIIGIKMYQGRLLWILIFCVCRKLIWNLLIQYIYNKVQESWAIAKMTMRCALYMGALKSFGSPWLCPRLLYPRFVAGFCSDWANNCAYKTSS